MNNTRTPAYAKAKKITSRSGANATYKHINTLRQTQMILHAQGDEASRQAAIVIGMTIQKYREELRTFHDFTYGTDRRPAQAGEINNNY